MASYNLRIAAVIEMDELRKKKEGPAAAAQYYWDSKHAAAAAAVFFAAWLSSEWPTAVLCWTGC